MECFSHFLINGVFESLYKSTYSDPNFPQYFHLNRFQRILASSPICIMHIFLLDSQSGSSVTQLHLTLCDPHGLQHTRLPCPSPTTGAYSNTCPSRDAIQQSHPLSFRYPPTFNLSQHQGLFK